MEERDFKGNVTWSDGADYDIYGETAQDKSDRVKSAQLQHKLDNIKDVNSQEYADASYAMEQHARDMQNRALDQADVHLGDLDYAKQAAKWELDKNTREVGGYTTPASRFKANGGWKGFWQKAGAAGLRALSGDFAGALNTFSAAKVMPHDFNLPSADYREATANKRNFSLGFGLQGNKASLNTQIGNLSKNFELKPSTKATEIRANRIVDTGWNNKKPTSMQYDSLELPSLQRNDMRNQLKTTQMVGDQAMPELGKFKLGADTKNKKMTSDMKTSYASEAPRQMTMEEMKLQSNPLYRDLQKYNVDLTPMQERAQDYSTSRNVFDDTNFRASQAEKKYDKTWAGSNVDDSVQNNINKQQKPDNSLPADAPTWARNYANSNPEAWNNLNSLAKRNGQDAGKVVNARNEYYQDAIREGYTPEQADNMANSKMVMKLIESGVKSAEAISLVATAGSLNSAVGIAQQSRKVATQLAKKGMTEQGKRQVLKELGIKNVEKMSEKAVTRAFGNVMNQVTGNVGKALVSRGAKTAGLAALNLITNNEDIFANTGDGAGSYDSYRSRDFAPLTDAAGNTYTDLQSFRESPYYTPEAEEVFLAAQEGRGLPSSRTASYDGYTEAYNPEYSDQDMPEGNNFDEETSDRNMSEMSQEERDAYEQAMKYDQIRDYIRELYGVDIGDNNIEGAIADNQKNGYVANSKFTDNLSYLLADEAKDEEDVQEFNQELTQEEFLDFIKANPWVADMIANSFGQQ